ncbi:helix-turn-helix domain-containing protein [Brucella pseudintermedia]|uniref:helix-turn-helix domain-containing protein n=1 Tax=Brucella pseudintermedia TaxID=370111 RepID=UPI0036712DA7|nr:helix-turn-helix domain-containing protein [Brucella pseudintermedia]
MIVAAYSRNTERGAAAIIARRRKEELERQRLARIAEMERREAARIEAMRREMERREREQQQQEDAIRRTDEILQKYREIMVGRKIRPMVRDIVSMAVEGTGFTHDDVVGQRRTREMMHIRHYAILCAWAFRTDMSLPALGRQFGGRDHTSILHAVRRFGFESRQDAVEFIKQHGRDATIARIPKRAA